jgi:NAD(P)-dependent dehydrogenase (short-subunit alcohol dehydrogenase family)
MSELKDKVAVVTGAFGALGQAVAAALVQAGARVALLGHGRPSQSVAAQFGPPQLLLAGIDLTDMAATQSALDGVRSHFGRVDIVVNVAGGFGSQKLASGGIETWDLMYSMNLKTAVITCKAALPHLLASAPGGRIINIGAGTASKAAKAGMGAYAASKVGVQKLTESLADELKDHDITVNAILPGTIDTPQNRKDMPNADTSRWVTPAAIADVIVFLASQRAAAVTGAAIPVVGRGV